MSQTQEKQDDNEFLLQENQTELNTTNTRIDEIRAEVDKNNVDI